MLCAVAPGPIWTPIPAQSFTPEMVALLAHSMRAVLTFEVSAVTSPAVRLVGRCSFCARAVEAARLTVRTLYGVK